MENKTSKRAVLFIFSLSSFFTPFTASSINIALPSIAKEFSLNAVMLSWVNLAFMLTVAVFVIPFGKIGDIYGRKKIFTYGIVIYTLASLMSALAHSGNFLIFSRFLQGIGSAIIYGIGIAILTSVFPPGERGKALGINIAATYLGLSLGPVLGGLLTQHFGWRSIFFFTVVIGIIIIIALEWKLKGEWAESRGEKLDSAGAAVFIASLFAFLYGFSLMPAFYSILLIAAGLAGLVFFYKLETRTANPVLDVSIFKINPVFVFSNLSALINYSATAGISFMLSLYLQSIKGLNPQQAGMILVAQPAVMAIFSPFAGKLSDKIESRIIASAGMAITAAGLGLFVFLENTTPAFLIIFNLMFVGLGFALFSSPNTNAIVSSVDRKYIGVASSMVSTMRLIGAMLSVGLIKLVFVVYLGTAGITPEHFPAFLSSIKISFAIFSVVCFGGVFASLARGNLHNGDVN